MRCSSRCSSSSLFPRLELDEALAQLVLDARHRASSAARPASRSASPGRSTPRRACASPCRAADRSRRSPRSDRPTTRCGSPYRARRPGRPRRCRRAPGTCRDGSRCRCARIAARRAGAAPRRVDLDAACEVERHRRVGLGVADAVDARDRGDDDYVAARQQRERRRVAHAIDLFVDDRVLLDEGVGRRDVRLGLVVVVVADEVVDRVVGEQLLELRTAAAPGSCCAR